jgi:hypothetical protein
MRQLTDRRGMALPLAIFALVIVGALVAGSFFIGWQEQRVGRNTVKLQQAFGAAEAGAQATVANWNTAVYNALAIGGTIAIGGTYGNNGWFRGEVRRLNDLLFLVRSEGFSRDSTARQQVGMLVRLRPIEINIQAALETQGATKIGGSSFIDGNDQVPAGWTGCPPLEPALPGIRIQNASDVTTAGCGGLSCVEGDPKFQGDPVINDSTLTTFGDLDFLELRNLASKIVAGGNMGIAPSVTGTTCNTGVASNWGSPLSPTGPCGNYFPIVWSDGDLSINGVQGQGVLIVNGDLSVQGNFEFY